MKLLKKIINKIYSFALNAFNEEQAIHLKYYNGIKVYLRKKTSDFSVFEDVFVREEYRTIVDNVHQIAKPVINILDLGANVGLTTLYLKKHVRNATIVCVEPFGANYKQMLRNLEINHTLGVIPLNVAVWSSHTQMETFNPHDDFGLWGIQLKAVEDKSNSIDTYTISQIKNMCGMETIDILKIDIEGSEFEIFKNKENLDIIKAAHIVAIEIHNDLGDENEIFRHFGSTYKIYNVQHTYFFVKMT